MLPTGVRTASKGEPTVGADTKIEWCDFTFNPWLGCTNVSPGCDHCYAEALMDKRYHKVQWGAGQPRVRTSEANWRMPIKWDKAAAAAGRRDRVFCASLADVFDNEVDPEWRRDLLRLIAHTQRLDWLLLTKRIGNAHQMLRDAAGSFGMDWGEHWRNVWIGATIVNQEEADRDIPKLLAVPAAKRFLSMEPLLGQVILPKLCDAGSVPGPHGVGGVMCARCDGAQRYGCLGIDWVIVGGESGHKARPFHTDWAQSIVDQCQAAGVACFVKQLGAHVVQGFERRIKRDKKGGDMSEWPHELRVREVPCATT